MQHIISFGLQIGNRKGFELLERDKCEALVSCIAVLVVRT